MCGTSSASYFTVTGAVRPEIVLPVSAGGAETTMTEFCRCSTEALRLAVALPGGGVYVTCQPVGGATVPALTVQVTSPLTLTSSALKSVGPLTWTVPAVPDGVIVIDEGSLSLVPHPQSEAANSQAATVIERIEFSRQ